MFPRMCSALSIAYVSQLRVRTRIANLAIVLPDQRLAHVVTV
jgi:hypothetical protein